MSYLNGSSHRSTDRDSFSGQETREQLNFLTRYVLKDSPAEQLLTAIREVHRGGSYLTPRLLTRLVDGFRLHGRGERQPRFGTLTKREREILKMLAEGKSVKEIASGFDLSVKTVEAHKFNLMRKLDIHNKAQLVQYAIQKKVIRLPEFSPA